MERVASDGSSGRLVSFINAVLEEATSSASAASAALLNGHRGSGRGRRGGALPAESKDTSGARYSGATPHTKVGYNVSLRYDLSVGILRSKSSRA